MSATVLHVRETPLPDTLAYLREVFGDNLVVLVVGGEDRDC